MSTFEERFLALDNNERISALIDIIEALAVRVGATPEQLQAEGQGETVAPADLGAAEMRLTKQIQGLAELIAAVVSRQDALEQRMLSRDEFTGFASGLERTLRGAA